jgi:superoxide dismutase, Cu-Zn family
MRKRRVMLGVAVSAAVAIGTVVLSADPVSAAKPWARATVRDARGVNVADVTFTTERRTAKTIINVKLRSFSGGDVNRFHGFHIHANDNAANGVGCGADPLQPASTWFVSADGHWKNDPAEMHGRHAGDLPSIYINNDGTAEMRFVVSKLTPSQVVGRAVILHAAADNFGNVPVGSGETQYTPGAGAVAATQNTGNAGERIACGVIGAAGR